MILKKIKENSRILSELAKKHKNDWEQTYNNSGQLGYKYDSKLYEAELSNKLGEDFGDSKYDKKYFCIRYSKRCSK